ncbi:MAG: NAD-dependent epimerase/dehydratase family protein [Candidatus Omnitrophica bacterium]|nr:NAD-dependent epimerase/dehydratase family protein [Candidatus Omnitrophota bacterium]
MKFFKGKKILVTGATGLVGINLLKKLSGAGAHIRAIYHVRKPVVRRPDIEYVRGDLTRRTDCDKAVAGMDMVFHCAANTSGAAVMTKTPLVHVTPNILMNAQLLEAAWLARVRKFMWLSSSTGYPVTGMRPVREEEMLTGEPYEKYFCVGWMKRYTEVLCRIYGEKIKDPMTTIVLRPTNIYGEHDDFRFETSHVMAALIRKVAERHAPVAVWGDGEDVRDLIYVGDFTDVMLLAMANVKSYAVFNIGFGKAYKVKDILKRIMKIDGFKDGQMKLDPSKPTMIPARRVDLTRMHKILGFKPATSLDEGIKKTLAWYRENPV